MTCDLFYGAITAPRTIDLADPSAESPQSRQQQNVRDLRKVAPCRTASSSTTAIASTPRSGPSPSPRSPGATGSQARRLREVSRVGCTGSGIITCSRGLFELAAKRPDERCRALTMLSAAGVATEADRPCPPSGTTKCGAQHFEAGGRRRLGFPRSIVNLASARGVTMAKKTGQSEVGLVDGRHRCQTWAQPLGAVSDSETCSAILLPKKSSSSPSRGARGCTERSLGRRSTCEWAQRRRAAPHVVVSVSLSAIRRAGTPRMRSVRA